MSSPWQAVTAVTRLSPVTDARSRRVRALPPKLDVAMARSPVLGRAGCREVEGRPERSRSVSPRSAPPRSALPVRARARRARGRPARPAPPHAHARAIQHRLPVEQLGDARACTTTCPRALRLRARSGTASAAPRARSAPSRPARPRGAAPTGARRGSTAVRRRAPSARAAGEGERGDLAGAKLRDEPLRRRRLGRALLEHVGPGGDITDAHTSTSTGRIIGRRPVRS